ncbi:MAG TPA: FG-GAP-like repeat-containing protein [Terriglobales bacterium]
MRSVRFASALVVLSCAFGLAQNNPVPFIDQPLVPSSAAPGGQGFTLTVHGANFVSGSVVNWNGTSLLTSYIGPGELTATVNPSNIAAAGTAFVTVVNPAPGGGTSNVAYFPVATPVPNVQLAVVPGNLNYDTVVADFNGDGKLDLAVFTKCCTFQVYLGNGDGTFENAVSYPGNNVCCAADFTGNGKLDLLVEGKDGIFILLGNGDGTFQSPVLTGLVYSVLAVGDFNGDGKLDAFEVRPDGPNSDILVQLGNGDGTFQGPTQASTCSGIASPTAYVADFNGDGKLDITYNTAVEGYQFYGLFCLLLGNGDGTFTTNALFQSNPIGGPFVIGDFNGDGKQDFVFDSFGVGTYIALGNGDGTFQTPIALTSCGGVCGYPAAVGDFADNGKLSIAGDNGIALGNGDGTFLVPTLYGTNVFFSGLGDFNGDGRLDLLSGSAVELQVLRPAAALSLSSLSFAPTLFARPSAPQSVTLQNAGNAPMAISSIGFGGQDPKQFSQTNNCGASLAVGAKCSINVTFIPTIAGDISALLVVNDNAPKTPQTVELTGIGEGFTVAASPAATTITPGQAGNYTVTVAPLDGFNQTVALSCSGAPAASTCTVKPTSITLDGRHTATADVAVVTTAAMSGITQPMNQRGAGNRYAGLISLSGLLGLAGIFAIKAKRPSRSLMVYALAFLCLISAGATMVACGGGNGGNGGGGNGGTPQGNYTLTITGTYNAGTAQLAHTVKVTLTVQ